MVSKGLNGPTNTGQSVVCRGRVDAKRAETRLTRLNTTLEVIQRLINTHPCFANVVPSLLNGLPDPVQR